IGVRGGPAGLVLLAKRASRGCGHVAFVGPAAAKRERANHAVAVAQRTQHPHADTRRDVVERRLAREPAPCLQSEALVPWPQTALEFLFAKLPLQVGQRNLHWAYDAALIAH